MLEINLLPWRILLKEKNNRIKKFFLVSVFIFISLLFTIHVLLNFILQNNGDDIDNLKNQLTELKNQTHEDNINPGILIIDQIHANQAELIHFFEFLEQETPPEISWETFTSKKNHIIALGSADSISVITHLVNTYHSKKNALLMNIVSLKKDDTSNVLQFKLHLMRSISPLLMNPKTHDNI
jgi:hypothetical protein